MTTILHIEDENNFRRDLCFMLQESGFDTIEAADGKEGLKMFEDKNPDIILCDINIPKISGYELLQNIRLKNNKNPYVPFFFLTGKNKNTEAENSTNLLANDFLTKPVKLSVLVEKINSAIDLSNNTKYISHPSFKLQREIEFVTAMVLSNKNNLLKQIAVNIENGLPPLEINQKLFCNAVFDVLNQVLNLSSTQEQTVIDVEYNYDNDSTVITISNCNLNKFSANQILTSPHLIKLAREERVSISKKEDKRLFFIEIEIKD